MIRKILPDQVAAETMSVQPMGAPTGTIFTMGNVLGPPVCTLCMITGTPNKRDNSHPWTCHNCGDFKLPGHLWSYTEDLQLYIQNRTVLFKERKIIESKKNLPYTVIKSFMIVGSNLDPNERYRSWLEEHVGNQGEDWNWDIRSVTANLLEVSFECEIDATAFNLSFQ